MSPLTVAFAVLIVASAFWARADQIIQATLLSMAGYGLLVLAYWLSTRPWNGPIATSITWRAWPCSASC